MKWKELVFGTGRRRPSGVVKRGPSTSTTAMSTTTAQASTYTFVVCGTAALTPIVWPLVIVGIVEMLMVANAKQCALNLAEEK
jgi:hypothetical protein